MAWLWSGSHSGSCTWTLWTSLLLSPDFKGKLWRAALSLLSGSVENTEEKEGEVFLRRKLWCNCRWSRYFFCTSNYIMSSCFVHFSGLPSWFFLLSSFIVNRSTSMFGDFPCVKHCSGPSRAISCSENSEKQPISMQMSRQLSKFSSL